MGDKGDASTEKGPNGDSATATAPAPDATGTILECLIPTKMAFTNAVGSIDSLQTVTITPTSPSITTDDATTYPHGSLTEIVFNNMTHSIVNGIKLVLTGIPGAQGDHGATESTA